MDAMHAANSASARHGVVRRCSSQRLIKQLLLSAVSLIQMVAHLLLRGEQSGTPSELSLSLLQQLALLQQQQVAHFGAQLNRATGARRGWR
jgi:hypothetical protein